MPCSSKQPPKPFFNPEKIAPFGWVGRDSERGLPGGMAFFPDHWRLLRESAVVSTAVFGVSPKTLAALRGSVRLAVAK